MLSNIVRSTTRQRARALLQDVGLASKLSGARPGPQMQLATRSCHSLPGPMRSRPVLCWRRALGASLLLASCGMLAAPTAFSLRRSDGPAKCEETPLQSDKGQDAKAKSSPVATVLKVSAALCCWGLFAGLWFASITLPAALVWAASTGRWKVVSSIFAAYCFPHMVQLPALPRSIRHGFWVGLEGWFPGGIQVVHSQSAGEPEPEPPTQGKRLFCIHPHGIYTIGALTLPDQMPEVRLCMAPYLYNFSPAFRMAADLLGIKVGSTGPRALRRLMRKGESPLALVPGGFEEATVTSPGTERVFLKSRAGFVKYALRHGYDLVPCYTVGDSDMFANPQGAWRFRWFLNDLSIPAVIPFGFPLLPLLPKRVPVKLAIGEPLEIPRIEEPTAQDVKKHHARYVAALRKLYEEASKGTASEGRPLELW